MGRVGNAGLLLPVGISTTLAAVACTGHWALYFNWKTWLTHFVTGPGRTSRLLLVLFLTLNWKSLPLGWTVRIFHSFAYHIIFPNRKLPQRALFHYSITASRTSLLETDYNMHKSNSTYFADLDISRSHLVTALVGPTLSRLNNNAASQLVRDKSGAVVQGSFGIGLGAVFCTFRREIAPLQGYEMWSRVLSWDRKWLYIVTHFVPKGVVRPTAWDGRRAGPTRSRVVRADDATAEVPDGDFFSRHVCATAISKYVFKLGRFTVHPSIVFEACGMLPVRPGDGGWRGGDAETGTPEELGELDESGEWDWRRVEMERRKGLEFAQHFHALDGTSALFDGGEDGAMGKFPLG